jgi:hypothetical protein
MCGPNRENLTLNQTNVQVDMHIVMSTELMNKFEDSRSYGRK